MKQTEKTEGTYDVAVVGAGSAGLQTAQTLGRMRQTAVVLGTGRYRNDPAIHMHNGGELAPQTAAALERLGAVVRTEQVAAADRGPRGLTVRLDGGESVELGGLFVKTEGRQAAPFAAQRGLAMSPVGDPLHVLVVDAFGRTSVLGVYAAGDMAQGPELPQPMSSVLAAAATGQLAATACVQDAAIARAQG